MMKLTHDLHTHTKFSHGKNTIEEMVKRARELKIPKLTISDHGRNHPFFGVDPKDFKVMREEIDFYNNQFDDIDILLGVEANIIGSDGTIDVYDEELENCDVIYAGYHYGYLPDNFKNFYSFFVPNVTGQFIPPIKDLMKGRNTETYLKMMEKYPNLFMITHPGDKMPIDIDPIAKMAAEKNVILEINQHHNRLNTEDLRIAGKYPVKFAVGSDAHHIKDVGNVGITEKMILDSGIDKNKVINVEFS